MENKIWTRLGVEVENAKEVIENLDKGLKEGFKVRGVRIDNILITENSKNKNVLCFVLDAKGRLNEENLVFSVKNHEIDHYRLYKAIRSKVKDFMRRERRDQEVLDKYHIE